MTMQYDADCAPDAVLCVGFLDEQGNVIETAASTVCSLDDYDGSRQCRVDPLQLRSGVFVPVAAILAPDGTVLGRWRLDRPVVVERELTARFPETSGPVELRATWTDAAGVVAE